MITGEATAVDADGRADMTKLSGKSDMAKERKEATAPAGGPREERTARRQRVRKDIASIAGKVGGFGENTRRQAAELQEAKQRPESGHADHKRDGVESCNEKRKEARKPNGITLGSTHITCQVCGLNIPHPSQRPTHLISDTC